MVTGLCVFRFLWLRDVRGVYMVLEMLLNGIVFGIVILVSFWTVTEPLCGV